MRHNPAARDPRFLFELIDAEVLELKACEHAWEDSYRLPYSPDPAAFDQPQSEPHPDMLGLAVVCLVEVPPGLEGLPVEYAVTTVSFVTVAPTGPTQY